MARETKDVKPRAAVVDASSKPSPWLRTRLSSLPLSVLLPPLSDVGQLAQFRSEFEERLENVQERAETADAAEAINLQVEQNMIQQVLQWLDVDGGES